jgi:hypothetical protein
MGRRKGSDNFGFRELKATKSVELPKTIRGADNVQELSNPLSFDRRFRPALNTKDFSLVSEYDYASLWTRWRRGYELAMYSQQAYDGLTYSFKYYPTGTTGVGVYLPGVCFMYPTMRSDMRMWMVGVRPRNSFNFLDVGYSITSVTQYDDSTYAVRLSSRFGAPVSFFTGEVVSNKFNADGTEKAYNYNNYTVTAVGINDVPRSPTYAPIFNTLFLSVARDKSWSVVDANTLAVPATGAPLVGEYLTTEMRAQCTCPDFLSRENVNLWETSLKKRYPFTRVQNLDPGIYDAGAGRTPRVVNAPDDPGFARSFGFIYLNQIYDIPKFDERPYSDPNVYYYQPKWCKHIYAAMWDMQLRYNQQNATSPWVLHQPSDEPLNEYYREKFDKDLAKQSDFLERERNLVWWQRHSPAKDAMPNRMMKSDMYNMMSKTLNSGDLDSLNELRAPSFEMYTFDEFNPFEPITLTGLQVYDGGTYTAGSNVVYPGSPVRTLDGSTYANGTQIPPLAYSLNGGTY